MRRAVAEILRQKNRQFGSDASVEASLDRFAAGAVAIVSGQQAGLFSGPSYTFYKALSAIRLADELSAEGIPAVAIFWLATEDHDLAEVNHAFWPAREGPVRLELPVEGSAVRRVGEVPLGEGVAGLVERAVGMLQGLGAEEIGRALAESLPAGETYAFGIRANYWREFLRGAVSFCSIRFLPELHRLAAPVYRAAIEQHAALGQELVARTSALERDRFHAQVKVTESGTLLFVNVDGERLPLRARNEEFLLGRRVFSAA